MATTIHTTAAGAAIYAKTMVNGAGRGSANVVAPNYVGWGKGTTAAATTDTALTTELTSTDVSPGTYARSSGTDSVVTVTNTNDTYQTVGTLTMPSNLTTNVSLSECGCFDASTSGNMDIHAVFTAVSLSPSFSFQATFQRTFTPQ